MIKKTLLIFSILTLALSCNDSQKEAGKKIKLKIKGSDTMYPLTKLLCTSFQQQNKEYEIRVEGGGTTAAFADFINGKIDVVAASRELKITEKERLDSLKKEYIVYTIAYDGLAVIVNSQNKIGKISREELEAIYKGKLTNWKELGGMNEKISVYALEKNNSADEFFKDKIMGEKPYGSNVTRVRQQSDLLKKIAANKGSIGYYNILKINSMVNYLSVSFDSSKTFIAPNAFNFQNRSYPISRPLSYYAASNKEAEMKLFTDYTKSLLGKRNTIELGFIPAQ
jgi:phosphate transport system substrate-binding protein